METTTDLNPQAWNVAHKIAIFLVEKETDVNELTKAIAYLRAYRNQENAGNKFFAYLQTLVSNAAIFRHSNQTVQYLRNINNACIQELKIYEAQPEAMLQILGWTARLMRYYKVSPIGLEQNLINEEEEISLPPQAEVIQPECELDQILEAKVLTKYPTGNKITYLINETFKISEKEPKFHNILNEGDTVKVKVTSLKEDGTINHVKYFKE